MLDPKLLPAIKLLWQFNQINQELEQADFILVLGSGDLTVPGWAAQIYKHNYANKILVSGGFGYRTRKFLKPEAEIFTEIIIQNGVPKKAILIENKSTNTGENIQFGYKLALENSLKMDKIILVTKSYAEKRALATFKKQWPVKKTEIIITSPPQTFEELTTDPDILEAIESIVKNTQRLKIYPKLGFTTETEIPDNVWEAFEFLVASGFNKKLVKN